MMPLSIHCKFLCERWCIVSLFQSSTYDWVFRIFTRQISDEGYYYKFLCKNIENYSLIVPVTPPYLELCMYRVRN